VLPADNNSDQVPPSSFGFIRGRSALWERRNFLKAIAGGGLATAACDQARAQPGCASPADAKSLDSIHKTRASADYHQSLNCVGGVLSSPIEQLHAKHPTGRPWQFDILVVGSGYGASTVAARLSQRRWPGVRLAIFERGQEWVPGTFPDQLKQCIDQSRLKLLGPRASSVKNATGLYNIQQFDEFTVMSGSGLGGSSLINAGVSIRPDPEVFLQSAWPSVLQSREVWEPYFQLAEYELGVTAEPVDWSKKMIASRQAGQWLSRRGARWEPARLTLTRTGCQPASQPPIVNRQGMLQRGCIDCGDCLTGCNVGAKNSLAMNYLPLAKFAGAEIYTGVEVQFLRKVEDWYEVHYDLHVPQVDGSLATLACVTTARMVVLGAGSLGSTEILLRSRCQGLSVSEQLGCRWTGNGDALGFVRKTECPTSGAGYSAYETCRAPVGPTIQTNLFYPDRPPSERILIQEGAAPRSYAKALSLLMRDVNLDNTQVLLGMGHDGAQGRISLNERGMGHVYWPGSLDSSYRRYIRQEFERVAAAMGGKYDYLRAFGDRLISVHPLGGCGMADDIACGVVNDRCQVFDASSGGVFQNLYVIDGASLPTSLACNPLLTITALAERCSNWIVNDPERADWFTPAAPSTLAGR